MLGRDFREKRQSAGLSIEAASIATGESVDAIRTAEAHDSRCSSKMERWASTVPHKRGPSSIRKSV